MSKSTDVQLHIAFAWPLARIQMDRARFQLTIGAIWCDFDLSSDGWWGGQGPNPLTNEFKPQDLLWHPEKRGVGILLPAWRFTKNIQRVKRTR